MSVYNFISFHHSPFRFITDMTQRLLDASEGIIWPLGRTSPPNPALAVVAEKWDLKREWKRLLEIIDKVPSEVSMTPRASIKCFRCLNFIILILSHLMSWLMALLVGRLLPQRRARRKLASDGEIGGRASEVSSCCCFDFDEHCTVILSHTVPTNALL